MSAKTTKLLRLPAVLALTGFSRPTIWRRIKEGKFPKPVYPFGGRSSAWPEDEVLAVINAAIEARQAVRR